MYSKPPKHLVFTLGEAFTALLYLSVTVLPRLLQSSWFESMYTYNTNLSTLSDDLFHFSQNI